MDGPSSSPALRVFLLDDHELVRRGVRELLEPEGDIEVVGEAARAAEARVHVPAVRPQVAVLDVRLPDGDGVTVCRDLRSAAARPRLPHADVLLRRRRPARRGHGRRRGLRPRGHPRRRPRRRGPHGADEVRLTVREDGRGLPAEPTRRSGLAHLLARAVELGGTCTAGPGLDGGTELTWAVPLP